MPVQVSHHPFGRFAVMRKIERDNDCAWCGNERPMGGAFRYGIELDERPGTVDWQSHTFCCIDHMRQYYGATFNPGG